MADEASALAHPVAPAAEEAPLAGDSATDEFEDPQARPLPPLAADDGITRMLCASVYLHASYADHVLSEFLAPTPAAICPPWGVDAVWLTRHAVRSRRMRSERDGGLLFTMAVLVAAGLVDLVLLLRGAIGVPLALVGWAALWPVGYLIAFGLVFKHYREARQLAVDLAYAPSPPDAPPLADRGQEERLEALNQANTVVFGTGRPFVGAGTRLDHWTMTLDVSKGALVDGARKQPVPFDGLDVHRTLLEAIPVGVRPQPSAANRLYVRGSNAATVPFLFPQGPVNGTLPDVMKFRRPVGVVPELVIRRFLRRPDDVARVYSVFEQRGWSGNVVVTMFVRARVVQRTLFLEVDLYAQRPLRGVFVDVRTIRMQHADEVPTLIRSVLPRALPLLLGAPGRRWDAWRGDRRDAADLVEVDREIARRKDINFGAKSSIREEASGGLPADQFQLMDEQMFYQVLSRRVMECTEAFLVGRGVDTTEFGMQRLFITERTASIANRIYASNAAAGGGRGTPPGSDGGD